MSELSNDQISLLERLRDGFDTDGEALSAWESQFTEDILEQFDEYADDTYLSEKQWAVIMRIIEKLEIS